MRDEKDLWRPLADQWRERECGVGGAEINTNGEAGAVFRQELPPEAVRPLFRADLELNLPSAIGVRVPHPKLKDAKFGDDGADADRHHLPHRDVQCRDRDFEQASVIKVTLGVGEDLSRRIAASYRGGEKPETPPCGR